MASHIVHRQQVILNIPKREEALAFQNRVSDLLRNELSASMEAIFDELFPTTDIIRIDSLLLYLGNIEAHNFEQEFKKHFIEKLRKSIPAIKNDLADEHSEQILKPEQSLAKAFIYFLENGYLPWYSPVENMAAWSNEIIAIFSDSEKIALYFFFWFRDKHVDNPVILQRLVLQFDNSFLEKLLSIITSLKTESWTLIYKDLVSFIVGYTNKSSPNRKEIWICIFKALLSPVISGNGTTLSVINDRELILRSLDLLTNHFKISIHSIITSLSESKSKETLKTDIVKKGLLDLKSLLISGDNLRNNTEDPAFIDKLKETEANNAHKNTEDISISKQTDLSKTSHVENTDHVGSNKNQKAYETQTDERFDSRNDPKKINIKKGTQDIRQNNTGDEKTKEEQENNKINHSNYQDEEQLKQQKGITAAKELEKQKITLTDNQDSISLNEPKKFETEQEISEKKKQGDNTKRPLPQSRRFTGIQESETLYIKGSGIVILHYFLSPYFNDLDLLVDGRFKDDTAHQRAVLLLYYLATGKTKVAEFDLTLSKILCGYPLEETLPATLILTKKEKTESKNLLEAIIHHWSPLKNTSVKGLRSAFFERDGKLTKKENGWLLTVEQKTIDVLLGKLPWGYSTIRLPWMQEILNVDWY